jgi:hypothetical protein
MLSPVIATIPPLFLVPAIRTNLSSEVVLAIILTFFLTRLNYSSLSKTMS